MARKPGDKFNQTEYVEKYMKEKITVKKVAFSNERDAALLMWTRDKTFSRYVKQLIRKDMEETLAENTPENHI